MKRLKVALIGQGRSGRGIHGAFFRSPANEWFEVAAVVEALPDRRDRAAQEYGCPVYADYQALFARDDIDLAVNATYSDTHYPITLDLLRYGFHVVSEKLFAMHAADCRAMIGAAEASGRMLAVFQQSHFAPYYRRIREILASGVLGRVAEIKLQFSGFGRRWDWQCSQRRGGGCLYNTGPHPMEQALDLLDTDERPTVVSRLDRLTSFGDAEDFAKILLLVPGKPVIDLEISSCNRYADFLYLIEGSRGSLRAGMQKIEYQYFRPEEAPERRLILESLSDGNGEPAYCAESLTWYTEEETLEGSAMDVGTRDYYHMIYDHLTAGGPLVIRPEKVLRQIEIMEEVHRQNPMPLHF